MLSVETATASDVAAVAQGMRQSDLREFLAVSSARDHAELAQQIVQRFGSRDDLIVAREDGVPVAVGGLVEHRPHVLTLFLFATDDFPAVGKPLVRFIVQRLFPPIKAAGVHRIDCLSIDGHDQAHRFIRALGLEQEAVLRAFGRDGEDFIQFAWLADARPSRH